MNKKDIINNSPLQIDNQGSLISTELEDPFSYIGANIKTLIIKHGKLSSEMTEFKNESESDKKKMLLSFIEVSDAFENILKNVKSKQRYMNSREKAFVKNCETIFEMLLRALSNQDILPVETVIGHKVNPYWHNIVGVVEQPGGENGKIVEEVRKGYRWNKKLIRAADVTVIKNPI